MQGRWAGGNLGNGRCPAEPCCPKEPHTVNHLVASSRTAPAMSGLPSARGELSAALLDVLVGAAPVDALSGMAARAVAAATDIVRDDDAQLSLLLLYAQHYDSLEQLDPALEWSPELLAVRGRLESAFEAALREQVAQPAVPEPTAGAVAAALFDLTSQPSGPSLAKYVARKAGYEQVVELLVHRTIYTLREADPHSWAIPRLTGRAKAALVEIQSDEYGGGNPERVHSTIFARTVRGVGLDDAYGTYVDNVPAITLASHNLMSLFGLNRRLRGAVVVHLAAFEMPSSIPNRFYGDGFRRHGYGEDVTWYFDEHVEADAVHEQIAAHDLAGSLAEDEPELLDDILF